MSRGVRAVVVGVWAALAGCAGAGGGQPAPDQEVALHEVGELVRGTTGPHGKGPAKASDFDKLRTSFPRGYEAVKSGEVVVVWGAGVKGEGDIANGGGEVVAYEKDAPNSGGYVLLTSGEVKKMTASEFNSAPKAK